MKHGEVWVTKNKKFEVTITAILSDNEGRPSYNLINAIFGTPDESEKEEKFVEFKAIPNEHDIKSVLPRSLFVKDYERKR